METFQFNNSKKKELRYINCHLEKGMDMTVDKKIIWYRPEIELQSASIPV